MASLHSSLAVTAAACCDIETAHDGPPHNLFLILCFAAFRLHAAATMRTALGQRNPDPLIHARRDGAACVAAVAAAGFAARAIRFAFGCASRMRRRLSLAGAQRGFQFPAEAFGFLLQALRFPSEPLVLFAQMLVFLLGFIQVAFGDKVAALNMLVYSGAATRFHPTLR